MSKKVRVYDDSPNRQRVTLNLSMQEAALVSLLLGATPVSGPGKELYDALDDYFPVNNDPKGDDKDPRSLAARSLPFVNTTRPHVLNYLGQFPGD